MTEPPVPDKKRRNGRPDDDANARAEAFLHSRRMPDGSSLGDIMLRATERRRELEIDQYLRRLPKIDEPPDDIDSPAGGEPDGDLAPTNPGPAGSVNWVPLGPSVSSNTNGTRPYSGRVRSLAVGPGGTRVYAAAANGGVWFTADAGATWAPLYDYTTTPTGLITGEQADALSAASLAVRFGGTAASDLVYVGTGEPAVGNPYYGVGIRRSAAGGAPGSWALEASAFAGKSVLALAIDPDDPRGDVVYAATSIGLFRRASSTTWEQITNATFVRPNSQVSDVVIAGSGASKQIYVAFQGDRVYRSHDGTNWTAIVHSDGPGRMRLAVAESAPNIVYSWRFNGQLQRLQSDLAEDVHDLPPASTVRQGAYDLAIAVDPTDYQTVYLLGTSPSVFKGRITTSGGGLSFGFNPANATDAWSDPTCVTGDVHADAHCIDFALNTSGTTHNPAIVWVGTDGGVYRSINRGANGTFEARNTGLAITQHTLMAQRWDTDAVIYSGSQDNSTQWRVGAPAWIRKLGGDGGGVATDPDKPANVMGQILQTLLYRSTDAGNFWPSFKFPPTTANTDAQRLAAERETRATQSYAPIATTPHGSATTLVGFGTNRLWVSDDWGLTWVTLPKGTNPYASAIPDETQDVLGTSWVQAIAFASETRIFAATSSTIWRYDRGGTGWNHTVLPTTGLPSYPSITDLAVEDAAAGTCYATLGRAGSAHLVYWDGMAWHEAMPTSVIDVPAHAVVVDPEAPSRVYVGTDVGCFKGVKIAGSTWNWELYSAGLPECSIVDMAFHERTRLLRAATHGRGVWEIPVDATSAPEPDLYLRVNTADTGRIVDGARYPWLEGAEDPLRGTGKVYHWMSPDIKVRPPGVTSPALPSPVDHLAFATQIGDVIDAATNTETASAIGSNRVFVQVQNRSHVSVPGSDVRVLALVADASLGLPALPNGYATHIAAGDTSSAWLAGSGWRFVDPAQPYKSPPGELNQRMPGIVEFTFNVSTLGLPAMHDHVCIAAFVSCPTDPITSTQPSVDTVTMQDKHIAHRNIHVVTTSARSGSGSGSQSSESSDHDAQTFLVDMVNPTDEAKVVDLWFEPDFAGTVAVLLTPEVYDQIRNPKGFVHLAIDEARIHLHDQWLTAVEDVIVTDVVVRHVHLRRQIERLSTLDRGRAFVAHGPKPAVLRKVPIGPLARLTMAVTIRMPRTARPGDRFHLDIVQREGDDVLGGSSYVIDVT